MNNCRLIIRGSRIGPFVRTCTSSAAREAKPEELPKPARVQYVYHPRAKTLYPEKQAYLLTKTQRLETRPAAVQKVWDAIDAKKFAPAFVNCVLEARSHETAFSGETPYKYPFGLLQNFFRVVACMASGEHRHLSELLLANEPFVTAYWWRYESKIAAYGLPTTLLTARTPLAPFFDHETVEKSREHELASTAPNSPFFDVPEVVDHPRKIFSTGFSDDSGFPHLHTMILVDMLQWPVDQIIQKGLMMLLSRLVADVRLKYDFDYRMDLPQPLSAQAIITNGKRFHFLWFQLNTLNFFDDSGIKNLVYIEEPPWLYRRIKEDRMHHVLGEVATKYRLTDFNTDTLRLFLTTLFMPPCSVAKDTKTM